MTLPTFTNRIAIERGCSPDLVRSIVTDALAALHESAVKDGIGTALVGAYWEVGREAAWHLGGLLTRATQHDPGELAELFDRLDPTMRGFYTIIERWEQESST